MDPNSYRNIQYILQRCLQNHVGFCSQMALAEQQLQQHEDVELRRLLKEQRAVHAEIERRQKVSNR